ncbi:MAG: hypothetical protein GW938_15510 [Leptospira sp.]|nr:hypothetical protein [Leptospira sp.]
MKRILFLFITLLFFTFCSNQDNSKKRERDLLLGLFLAQNASVYEQADCQLFYTLNPVYVSGGYAERFISDRNQYLNIIVGDSTIDISHKFEGYFNPNLTQINAVSGDTLCDYRSRIGKSINTSNPSIIITSTIGGNDLLRSIPNERIVETFRDYNSNLQTRFPSTKRIYIEVHPTFVDKANLNRKIISAQMRALSQDACWVDPDPCFSSPLLQSEMLDSIHYAKAPALCIKNLVKTNCGGEF